jgi:hypothetical protein
VEQRMRHRRRGLADAAGDHFGGDGIEVHVSIKYVRRRTLTYADLSHLQIIYRFALVGIRPRTLV